MCRWNFESFEILWQRIISWIATINDINLSLKAEIDKLKKNMKETFSYLKKVQKELNGINMEAILQARQIIPTLWSPWASKAKNMLTLLSFETTPAKNNHPSKRRWRSYRSNWLKSRRSLIRVQDYRYSYSVKLVDVPEIRPVSTKWQV